MKFQNAGDISDSLGSAISVTSLVKKYKHSEVLALNGLDLTVEKGEFFGLLGPNGAGKTTAISIMNGFLASDGGTISIFKKPLKSFSAAIKKEIGFVPQDLALYENLTARENLFFFGKLYNLKGPFLEERVEYCLEFTQLQEQRNKKVSGFSGGMKRRLNLSAALLHSPALLFLDEPTVGIDAQSRQLIHDKLQQLNSAGTTLVYTTHYMEEAEELCSHVGIIDEGRIIQQGRCRELTRERGFSSLNDLFFSITGKQIRDV